MDVDIYLRKSRLEEQSNQAETLQRHKETLYRIADQMGYHVNMVFEEVVSGESLYARPQMMALLEKVEGGGVDAVLCMDIDRLGRGGMRDQGIILDVFRDSNTKIITPEHIYDLNDESDEQLTEFKAFFARQEYKQITKRLRRGRRQSVSEGCYISNAPFGYQNIVKDKKPTLEIVEDEAKYVRMIFDLYCQGVGSTHIANMLTAAGIKPRRSDRWRRNGVMLIIRNPVYIGQVVWNRTRHIRKGAKGNDKHLTIQQPEENWITVKGLHEPIISKSQYLLAQEIADARYIPPANNGTIKSPLAGLIRCSRCGMNMQRLGSRLGTLYLVCNTPGCCAAVQYEFVEPVLLDILKEKLADVSANIPSANDSNKYKQIHESIKSEISKTQKQKDNIYTLFEQGEYDVITYRQRMKSVSDRLDELAAQEKAAAINVEKYRRDDKEALTEKITNVLDVYNSCDARERNLLLKSIIDHIDYYKEKKSKPSVFNLVVHFKQILIR